MQILWFQQSVNSDGIAQDVSQGRIYSAVQESPHHHWNGLEQGSHLTVHANITL